MNPDRLNTTWIRQLLKTGAIYFFVYSLFYVNTAYAQLADIPVPTLDKVLERISENIPQLMQFVSAFAYVIGIYFVIMGVMEMKHFGESRGMMSQEHGLKKPLLYLFVGAALIYLPTTIQTGLDTLWSSPNPLAYVPVTGNAWSQLIANSFLILQFIGLVAFIRGLIILTHLGGHGGQPGTFAKGMTHIIGGILCINMYDTVRMVLATLGLDTLIS